MSNNHGPNFVTMTLSHLASNLIKYRFLPRLSTLKLSLVLQAFEKVFLIMPGIMFWEDRSFPTKQCSIWQVIKDSRFGSKPIRVISSFSDKRSFFQSSIRSSASISRAFLCTLHSTRTLTNRFSNYLLQPLTWFSFTLDQFSVTKELKRHPAK